MLVIYINEQKLEIEPGSNLQQAVELYINQNQSVKLGNIALVINQNIIPSSFWQSRRCQNQDSIEIFTAVAGG
ncbi:sulfur carrier protein ThiS [Paraglaciecola sp. L3A3]|uniref:sulfur carrier protein ThiS n=1 Tax=Paraglaciecola sp. L3A3 TaxID=2686358 RepID=UPI00131BD908|nr:sulfur carrier protein ThiS [Paraglaciecola sp. L3A3]